MSAPLPMPGRRIRYLCAECSLPITNDQHECMGEDGYEQTALLLIWRVVKAQGEALFN